MKAKTDMNREIKFRAWDKNIKQFVIPRLPSIWSVGIEFGLGVGDLVLMQYTGLKDKNRTEMFEGDIVIADGHTFLIIWDLQACSFRYTDGHGNNESLLNYDNVEVIGDVYQYPELMK